MTNDAVWTGEPEDDIPWTGDLDDDCFVEWLGMHAHAEALDGNAWFCTVSKHGETIFHSAGADMTPKTGEAARSLCELVMMSEWAGEQIKARRRREELEAKRNEFLGGLNDDFDRLAAAPEAWDDHRREMKEIGS